MSKPVHKQTTYLCEKNVVSLAGLNLRLLRGWVPSPVLLKVWEAYNHLVSINNLFPRLLRTDGDKNVVIFLVYIHFHHWYHQIIKRVNYYYSTNRSFHWLQSNFVSFSWKKGGTLDSKLRWYPKFYYFVIFFVW